MADQTIQEVTEVVTAYGIVQEANNFAEKVIFEEENITGKRYRYIISNMYEEGE